MTLEQTKEAIRVMQAYVDGKEVECKYLDVWARIAAKTMRPWTADEVPLGAWLRHIGQGRKAIIIDVTFDQQIGIHGSYFSPQFVFAYCEHSLDGGKTWLPCGVEEESK